MQKRKNTPLIKKLDQFTHPIELINDNQIPFDFVQEYRGNIIKIHKNGQYQFFFIFIQPFTLPFANRFILVLQRENQIVSVEKAIKGCKKRDTSPSGVIYLMTTSFAENDLFALGKYTCYLYQQRSVLDESLLIKTDFASYLQQTIAFDGCYITNVDIDKHLCGRYKKREETKNYYTDRIIFSRNQKPPEGKNKTIIIIEDTEAFLKWLYSVQHKSDTGFSMDRLMTIVNSYISKNKTRGNGIHPYYRTAFIKNLVGNLMSELTNDFLEKTLHDLIDTCLRLTHPFKLIELMQLREQRYTKLRSDHGLDQTKLTMYLQSHIINPEFCQFIKSDYDWYILNEAVELTEAEKILSNDDKTDKVFKIFIQIKDFEDRNYTEEKRNLNL